jgi:hypothetical protein
MQVDKAGATHYFGIGTATYKGEHSSAVREAQQLGLELGSVSVSLEKGFHAHKDSALTRTGRGERGSRRDCFSVSSCPGLGNVLCCVSEQCPASLA